MNQKKDPAADLPPAYAFAADGRLICLLSEHIIKTPPPA